MRTGDSEMLYNVYPRTFDLTDVTGVMNICDRHRGRSPCEYPVFCNRHCPLAVRVCIRLGSLAIAAAFACDSSTCEGPPSLYNRPCRLRPPSTKRNFAGGDLPFHLIRASTRHKAKKTPGAIDISLLQCNWAPLQLNSHNSAHWNDR